MQLQNILTIKATGFHGEMTESGATAKSTHDRAPYRANK